ncbi:MAG: sigma-54 dependent transcriptional regulator [Acidobacteriia bacterium]|nr:sigma-54 dependent transcriptional regulator [Terriglobia bacterium]
MTLAAILPPPTGGVLVASPSTSLREQVLHSLPDRRWPVQEALGGAEALVKLETGDWQVLYLDRRLPDLDAEELIEIIRQRFPGIEVVMLDSDSGQPLPASGASHPQWWREAPELSQPHPANSTEERHPAALCPEPTAELEPLPGMIGRTDAMERLYQLARLVAPRTTTVLITGPTGTGKELVARAIHQLSPRAARPFVVVNCAAIPESLLESELFGHVRGAFTGAVQAYSGRIHAAQGGTLFLDEVGELSLSLQAKLLRFLDLKEVQRLGSAEAMRVDVRVVAATNADLARRVGEGSFRDDLYYRLVAFPLELPPLAERVRDILPLAEHFLQVTAAADRSQTPVLGREAVSILQAHAWGGNVRELQQVVERAAIMANGAGTILPEHLYFPALTRRRAAGEKLPGERKSKRNLSR